MKLTADWAESYGGGFPGRLKNILMEPCLLQITKHDLLKFKWENENQQNFPRKILSKPNEMLPLLGENHGRSWYYHKRICIVHISGCIEMPEYGSFCQIIIIKKIQAFDINFDYDAFKLFFKIRHYWIVMSRSETMLQ